MTDMKPSYEVMCHYCNNLGHVRRDCKKFQNRNRRFLYVHESLRGVSTPSTMLAKSGKLNTSYFLFLKMGH